MPYILEGRTYKVQFANIAAVGAVPSTRVIAAGTGLAGGGDLSENRVISIAAGGVGFDQLALSGVAAGTYGSGSAIPVLTVDAKGRVTSASTVALDVTGFVPTSRTITAGNGLTGGGSLANNISLAVNFSATTPSALGVASAGIANTVSRGDHVHPAVNLSDTTQTQGALPLGRGGTGDALSPVAGAVVYSTGSKFALTNPGIAGQVLLSGGTDEPQWGTISGVGTVTSVNLTAGTGISVSGGPITTAGSINVVNTAPDQIVSLTGAGLTSVTGTYPNFTITSTGGTGTVTSVSGTGSVSGLSLSGTVTSAGSLTLGGTLVVTPSNFASQTANTVLAAPNGSAGVPTFRAIVAADIPTLNQNTTGTASNVTGVVAVANGGTGASIAATARSNLSAAASGANTDITSIALTTGTISASPVSGTDIVNKLYADSIASGINFHQSVRLATAAALPANTYNNGTSGVGATLTANANGALTVDGVAAVVGNRILVKNEATQANNGVYTVTQVGSGAAPYILTRATDFDSAGAGVDQIDAGDFFLVTAGSTQSNTSWVQQTPLPITVGTTALVFTQFAAPVLYSAGTGLTLAGTVFSITNTGVSAATYGSASSVPVVAVNAQGQATSVTNTPIAIAASQITSGVLPAANGGTGLSSPGTSGNVLTSNGTAWVSQLPSAGGITYTAVKTSNYTAANNDGVQTNTSGGAFTVTLPATPSVGAQVFVIDTSSSWATNNLTVGRNGSTIEGLAEDLVCNISNVSVQLVYSGTTWNAFAQVGGAGAGVVSASGGGTGLTSSGTAGNVLTSDGTGWTSAAPIAAYPQNIQSSNYTLVLGDAGKQIYSANTGAQTITIPTNASVAFPIGTIITLFNMGTSTITLSVAGVSVYQIGSTTAVTSPKIASGVPVQLVKTGTNAWNILTGTLTTSTTASYLIAAGGGSGGSNDTNMGTGGGGAGGLLSGTSTLTFGTTYTITVGAGAAVQSSNGNGNTGSNSSALSLTASGGGGGSGVSTGAGVAGASGGGGSGSFASGTTSGGAGTSGQGNNGGAGQNSTSDAEAQVGGGGGGASAVGAAASGTSGGNGGAGTASSITGSSVTYAGGGGGGKRLAGTAGTGGAGGGGNGGAAANGSAGTANRGGGGGGAGTGGGGTVRTGGAGGSGVVILSIPTADYTGTTTGSPTVTTSGSNTILQFNSSGSYTA
jgi:hypothetical protein